MSDCFLMKAYTSKLCRIHLIVIEVGSMVRTVEMLTGLECASLRFLCTSCCSSQHDLPTFLKYLDGPNLLGKAI